MSFGMVMFWKAFIVSLWAAVVEAWFDFRKRRQKKGIPLRKKKDGTYEAYDWTQTVENVVRFIGRCLMTIGYINMAFWLSVWVYVKWIAA